MKVKVVVFTLALLFGGVVVSSADSPHMGTWKLNEAKSKFAPGSPKNTSVIYEAAGEDVKVIVDGVDASGSPTHNEWTGKFDRKFYPVTGDANTDMRAYNKISNRIMTLINKKDNKVTVTGRIVVSTDGKTRTITTRANDSKGKWIINTAVYDKQ